MYETLVDVITLCALLTANAQLRGKGKKIIRLAGNKSPVWWIHLPARARVQISGGREKKGFPRKNYTHQKLKKLIGILFIGALYGAKANIMCCL